MFEKGHFNNFDQTLTFSSIVPRLPYPTAWQSRGQHYTFNCLLFCHFVLEINEIWYPGKDNYLSY